MGQSTAKILQITRPDEDGLPAFDRAVKAAKAGIQTFQTSDRGVKIQIKGNYAHIWANGAENFLAGMNLPVVAEFEELSIGAYELGGIFSAVLVKKQAKKGDNVNGK